MRASEKLSPVLFGVNMEYGKIDIPKGRKCHCFFITEHTGDEEFIRHQAMDLLMAGVREFYFVGRQSILWHNIFDLMYVKLFMDEIYDRSKEPMVTIECDDADDFVFFIEDIIAVRSFVPCINYLIYDDRVQYDMICSKLKF